MSRAQAQYYPFFFLLITLCAMAELGLTAFLISAGNESKKWASPRYHSLLILFLFNAVWTLVFSFAYVLWVIDGAQHVLANIASSVIWLMITSILWGTAAGVMHNTRGGGTCAGRPPIHRCRQSLTVESLGWTEFALSTLTLLVTCGWVFVNRRNNWLWVSVGRLLYDVIISTLSVTRMSNIPKAVLYYSVGSVWSAAVLFTLEEKGYNVNDEIDLKVVDLSKGENFSPTFLRLNAQASVPTLVVPLQNTLSEEVESRYKAITNTKAIIEFLDKSRSPLSRTHTTSSAPAPSLTPATIAFSSASNMAIDEIFQAELTSPISLEYYNATDDTALGSLAKSHLPFLQGRQSALERYLSEADSGQINVTEKVKSFWQEKLTATRALVDVYDKASKPESELSEEDAKKRQEFYAESKQRWRVYLKEALIKLNTNAIGPFYFGDQVSITDMHLASWLARVVKASGGTASDDGKVAVARVAKQAGFSFEAGETKLGEFWDAIKGRGGWEKVYGKGLW